MTRIAAKCAAAIALAILGGSCGFDPPSGGASDLPVIARGEKVDLAANAEKGKHTLFVFGADW